MIETTLVGILGVHLPAGYDISLRTINESIVLFLILNLRHVVVCSSNDAIKLLFLIFINLENSYNYAFPLCNGFGIDIKTFICLFYN